MSAYPYRFCRSSVFSDAIEIADSWIDSWIDYYRYWEDPYTDYNVNRALQMQSLWTLVSIDLSKLEKEDNAPVNMENIRYVSNALLQITSAKFIKTAECLEQCQHHIDEFRKCKESLEPLEGKYRFGAIEELIYAWQFLHAEKPGEALKCVRNAMSALGYDPSLPKNRTSV